MFDKLTRKQKVWRFIVLLVLSVYTILYNSEGCRSNRNAHVHCKTLAVGMSRSRVLKIMGTPQCVWLETKGVHRRLIYDYGEGYGESESIEVEFADADTTVGFGCGDGYFRGISLWRTFNEIDTLSENLTIMDPTEKVQISRQDCDTVLEFTYVYGRSSIPTDLRIVKKINDVLFFDQSFYSAGSNTIGKLDTAVINEGARCRAKLKHVLNNVK